MSVAEQLPPEPIWHPMDPERPFTEGYDPPKGIESPDLTAREDLGEKAKQELAHAMPELPPHLAALFEMHLIRDEAQGVSFGYPRIKEPLQVRAIIRTDVSEPKQQEVELASLEGRQMELIAAAELAAKLPARGEATKPKDSEADHPWASPAVKKNEMNGGPLQARAVRALSGWHVSELRFALSDAREHAEYDPSSNEGLSAIASALSLAYEINDDGIVTFAVPVSPDTGEPTRHAEPNQALAAVRDGYVAVAQKELTLEDVANRFNHAAYVLARRPWQPAT